MDKPPKHLMYDGENFATWKWFLEIELRGLGLERLMSTPGTNADNANGLRVLARMVGPKKLHLLRECTTVERAILLLQNDYTGNSVTARYLIENQITELKFQGIGSMRQYFDKLEHLTEKMKFTGEKYEDSKLILKLKRDLDHHYDPVVMTFTHTSKISDVKAKLVEYDDVLASRKKEEVDSEEKKKLSELEMQIDALKVELTAYKTGQIDRKPRFTGTCFNCGKVGHRLAVCRTHTNKPDCKCVKCANKQDSQYSQSPFIANVITNESDCSVVLDSGATDHFCNGSVQLDNFKVTPHLRVGMANGHYSYIKGCGSYFNKDLQMELTDVKAVSSLKQGLVSVARLTDQGYKIIFDKTGANIILKNQIVSRVPRIGNLYTIKMNKTERNMNTEQSLLTKLDPVIWHQRLGHTGEKKMKQLKEKIGEISLPDYCDSCKRGKLKQGPFHQSESRASRPLELVHIDLAGPHPITGYDGSHYFMVFVDDFSRYIVVYVLKDRKQVFQAFKRYRQLMESHVKDGHKVAQIQTDQPKEFLSNEFSEYLIEHQIHHRLSTSHSHQQNGIAERAIQSIRNIARTNLIEANAPEKFWPETVRIAAYQYNVVPHSTDPKSTPFERMFDKIPDYNYLRPFGALTYFYKHPVQRDSMSKWQPTGTAGAFLGYQENMKAYRVWDPSNRTVVKTCNTEVIEGQMYWKNKEKENMITPTIEDSDLWSEYEEEPLQQRQVENELNNHDSNEEFTSESRETLEESIGEPITDHHQSSNNQSSPSSPILTRKYPIRERRQVTPLQIDPKKKSYVEREIIESNQLVLTDNPKELGTLFINEAFTGLSATGVVIPQSYSEAKSLPEWPYWSEAINDEISSLLSNEVYHEINRKDAGRRPLTTKWIFSLKTNPDDDTIERFKARIVIRGFEQKEGIDYDKIFAPVVSHVTVRAFLTHAAVRDMEVHHIDVKTAFLHSELDRELYCEPPEGINNGETVWKLLKSLYGLRQAPLCWHKRLCEILLNYGFVQGKVDQCVFVRKTESGETYILVYVDDILAASSTTELTKNFKNYLKSQVTIRDLGKVKQFIGLQVEHIPEKKCYTLSQEKLITDYVKEFNLSETRPIRRLPEVEHMRPGVDCLNSKEQTKYRQLVGGMLYITNLTRPDVCFVVNYLSRFMQKATKVHLQNAEKALTYLNNTKDRKLHLGNLDDSLLKCFSDASFTREEKDQSGIIITYHGSIIQWISRKQENYNQSSTEAEYCALQLAADECLWLRQLLIDWNVTVKDPTVILEDNKQVIKLVHNGQVNTRAKYLAVKLRVLHDLIVKGFIDVQFIPSKGQWADMLTKSQQPQDIHELYSGKPLFAVRNQREC